MKLYLLLVATMLLTGSTTSNDLFSAENNNTYDSIVVAKITDITGDQYQAIVSATANIDQLNIEYCCIWSGVMVLKLNKSSLNEVGDLHTYVKSVLLEATPLKKLEILHVYTGLSGLAKC